MADGLWKTALNVVGGFLSISVGASFLYETTLRRTQYLRVREEFVDILEEKLDEKIDRLVEGASDYGFVRFYPSMDFELLFDSLRKEDELWCLDTYVLDHHSWIPNLRRALERGAKIKIMIIDPSSRNVTDRAEEIKDLNKDT